MHVFFTLTIRLSLPSCIRTCVASSIVCRSIGHCRTSRRRTRSLRRCSARGPTSSCTKQVRRWPIPTNRRRSFGDPGWSGIRNCTFAPFLRSQRQCDRSALALGSAYITWWQNLLSDVFCKNLKTWKLEGPIFGETKIQNFFLPQYLKFSRQKHFSSG